MHKDADGNWVADLDPAPDAIPVTGITPGSTPPPPGTTPELDAAATRRRAGLGIATATAVRGARGRRVRAALRSCAGIRHTDGGTAARAPGRT